MAFQVHQIINMKVLNDKYTDQYDVEALAGVAIMQLAQYTEITVDHTNQNFVKLDGYMTTEHFNAMMDKLPHYAVCQVQGWTGDKESGAISLIVEPKLDLVQQMLAKEHQGGTADQAG